MRYVIGSLHADGRRVRQILFNLLSNAINYSEAGQTVTLVVSLGPKSFGAPNFIAAGELFWGNDRLEQALRWASSL